MHNMMYIYIYVLFSEKLSNTCCACSIEHCSKSYVTNKLISSVWFSCSLFGKLKQLSILT